MGLPGMDDWFYCEGQSAAIAHPKASVNLCRADELSADRSPHIPR
ncbi:MAG TPA: hypothetical protein V6D20_08900 [Candidatus Obscuribacterales bacterium]